jgi:hypothetical protein
VHCRPAGIQRQPHIKQNQQWKEETRAGLQQQLARSAHAFDLARCPMLHVSVLPTGTSQEDPHKEDTSKEGYTRYSLNGSGSRAGSSKSLYVWYLQLLQYTPSRCLLFTIVPNNNLRSA